jgi:hypothetical protein
VSAVARIAAMSLPARRALAVLLLALAMLLVWVAVFLPIRALVSSQEQWREGTAGAIAADRGMLSLAEQLRVAREALKTSPLPARLYASSATGGPDVQLQDDLRAALTRSGVEPTNFKVLPAGSFRNLRAHRVEFASIMTVDQLQAFFIALEGQQHFVRIERLQLGAPSAQRTDENPRINVLMEARGYSLNAPVPAGTRVAYAH